MKSCKQPRFLFLPTVVLLVSCSVAQAQNMDQGHRILLNRGLQIQAVTNVVDLGVFDIGRWNQSNFTGVDFQYGPYPTLAQVPSGMQGVPWSRWMHWSQFDTDPRLYPQEIPFASDMVRFQMKDEQLIGEPAETTRAAEVFAILRGMPELDDVILHTDQAGYGTSSTADLQNYMQVAQPDMLMFNSYHFNNNSTSAGGSPTVLYSDLEQYRKLGLAGNDGSGAHPIPTAMYTQTLVRNGHSVSESEIRLNNFSAWAFGYKFVESFTYNLDDTLSVLFDASDTSTDIPTAQFFQVAETNRQSLNLGPALVRLVSTDVRMKMGRHIDGGTATNDLPNGVSTWEASADPYITGISATNLGTKNNSLEGDAILGYYKPLDASFTNPGFADDIYFMVLNGLSDPIGTALETTQNIHLDFDFSASGIDSLQRLSRDTGLVEVVPLVSDGGSLYHIDLSLKGGEGDLFKFNNGGEFVLPRAPGDFNGDGNVTIADYDIMKGNWFTNGNPINYFGELTGNGIVDQKDFSLFKETLFPGGASAFESALANAVPEPHSFALLLTTVPAWLLLRFRSSAVNASADVVSGGMALENQKVASNE